MNYIHMFQWNIPADNQWIGQTDRYLNVIASWNGESYYHDGSPMVFIDLINPTLYTCLQVKNWDIAERQIKKLATSHFADIAKQERINQARAILATYPEIPEIVSNPVLTRYAENNTLTTTN